MENLSKKNKTNLILVALVVVQLLVIAWLVFEKVSLEAKTSKIITDLENNKSEKDSISNELAQLFKDYESLKTNNDTLNARLTNEQARIQQLIADLKKVKTSSRYEIEQYKKELETLREIMRSYIVQIDSLNTKNQVLTAENQRIKNNYDQVINKNLELANLKDSLQTKVQIAATLKAVNMQAIALNSRDKQTSRVSKTDKFQVCFVMGENKIASKGNKIVYIRIADPNGNVLHNENSGFFVLNNKELAFSAAREVNYQGDNVEVCLFYINSKTDLAEGQYTIDIFVDGREIGTTYLLLK